MHEFSLAQALLTQLQELARTHGAGRVLRVRLAVGREAGIVLDSFCFGFEAIAAEYPLTRESVLQIEQVPGTDLVLKQVEME